MSGGKKFASAQSMVEKNFLLSGNHNTPGGGDNGLSLRKMFWYYDRFKIESKDILGKKVRHNANILFHLMRLIGKNPEQNNFPGMGQRWYPQIPYGNSILH